MKNIKLLFTIVSGLLLLSACSSNSRPAQTAATYDRFSHSHGNRIHSHQSDTQSHSHANGPVSNYKPQKEVIYVERPYYYNDYYNRPYWNRPHHHRPHRPNYKPGVPNRPRPVKPWVPDRPRPTIKPGVPNRPRPVGIPNKQRG